MNHYVRKIYFLLLIIKKQGEALGDNPSDDDLKEAKNKINNLFNSLNGTPLEDVTRLYEIFIANLPNEIETNNLELQLDIPDPIKNAEDQPEADPPEINSPYDLLYNAIAQANNVFPGNNFSLEELKNHSPEITYADLSWIRKERNPILRRSEYGNTDTYKSIAHKIKEAIVGRLITLGDKTNGDPVLSAVDYDKYLLMMKKHCGRGISTFFKTNSESAFIKQFVRGLDAPSVVHQPTDPSMQP